jgi:hypothetical protein
MRFMGWVSCLVAIAASGVAIISETPLAKDEAMVVAIYAGFVGLLLLWRFRPN